MVHVDYSLNPKGNNTKHYIFLWCESLLLQHDRRAQPSAEGNICTIQRGS